MVRAAAKVRFAVCLLLAVSNVAVNAFPTTSSDDNALIVIQQDNAIDDITDAITVSCLQPLNFTHLPCLYL